MTVPPPPRASPIYARDAHIIHIRTAPGRGTVDTRSLAAFKLVYELGSLAQAANALYISRQGLSKTIAGLESELGCRLFDRTSHGVEPTEAARALYPRALEIAGLLDSVKRDMAAARGGVVRAAVSSGYFLRFGSEFFREYEKRNPGWTLRAEEHFDEDVLTQVASGRADCGFTPARADRDAFDIEGIARHPYLLLVNAALPLARHGMLDYGDLEGLDLIALGNGHVPYSTIAMRLESAGIKPASFQPIIEISTGINLARRGEACCFITDFAASSFASDETVALPFRDPDLTWDLSYVRRKGTPDIPAVAALRDQAVSWVHHHRETVF